MSAQTSLDYPRILFPTGALYRAYKRIIQGQKGKNWERVITISYHDTSNAQHRDQICATKLLEINEIHPQNNYYLGFCSRQSGPYTREEIEFSAYHPTKPEFTVKVSAENKTRVNTIRAILVEDLNLECAKPGERTAKAVTKSQHTKKVEEAHSLEKAKTIQSPEKVTIKWISEHVPVAMLWGALVAIAAIVTGAFSLGRWSATIEPKLPEEQSIPSPSYQPVSSDSGTPAASE